MVARLRLSRNDGFVAAINGHSAGGYWPVQYQLPGASQMRLAGSATHSLDFLDTLRTLKMRTLPYLEVYACVNFFESSVTPLVGLYTGASIFFAVLCLVLMVCASAFGVYQVYRLREAIDRSSIAVIALETLSQMFFFLRTLNGPGFDVGYRMVLPHPVYRMMQSLFQDLNMIALLIVGGQLRQRARRQRRHLHLVVAALEQLHQGWDGALLSKRDLAVHVARGDGDDGAE